MFNRKTLSLAATAVAFAAVLVSAPAFSAPVEQIGAIPASSIDVGTSQDKKWNYAVRTTLHTTLPSTPASNLGSLYNALHRPEWGGAYSGVAALNLTTSEGLFGCSGSLLSTGRHILTAAHCVTDTAGTKTLLGGEAFFPSINTGTYTGAFESVSFSSVSVHPGWTGQAFLGGNDLAVITLDSVAPAGAQRYELYTAGNELTQIHNKVGWGQVGLGNGTVIFGGGFRKGQNNYDATGALVDVAFGAAANPGVLYYDFDDGLFSNPLGYAPHDAFGFWFGINHLGLGLPEVISAPGDSGGPTFIDGKVAGITSFGLTIWDDNLDSSDATDPTFGPDSSFGEFGADTRVSTYADWITAQIPEPETYALMLAGLVAVGGMARRRRRVR